jgi:hypothetical protein
MACIWQKFIRDNVPQRAGSLIVPQQLVELLAAHSAQATGRNTMREPHNIAVTNNKPARLA